MAGSLVALVVGAVAMGASPLFVRYTANEVSQFASAFWRVGLAVPFLFIWSGVEKRVLTEAAPARTNFLLYPALAGLAFAGDLIFWHLSLVHTTVANATFFAATTPIYVIAISYFFFRQKIQRSSLAGVALCLFGGVVLLGYTLNVKPEQLKGDIYGLVTAFFFSLYFLAIGRARRDSRHSASITFVQTAVSALALLTVALTYSFVSGAGFLPKSRDGLWALVCLAIISQVMGQGLLTVAMGRINPVFSSFVIFMEAVVAALLAWIFLDERLTLIQCAGGIFVLLGLWVARPRHA